MCRIIVNYVESRLYYYIVKLNKSIDIYKHIDIIR